MVNINNSSSNIFKTEKFKTSVLQLLPSTEKKNPKTQNGKIWFLRYQYTEQELFFYYNDYYLGNSISNPQKSF